MPPGKVLPTEARQLIDEASFGSEALRAIKMPFDAAWAKISQNFGDDPVDVKAARIRLAEALLSIANGTVGTSIC
jgi:hypothetical protein